MDTESDFEREGAELIESALKRRQAQLLNQKAKEEEYILRKQLIQDYFLRVSSVKKRDLILKFLDNVRSLEIIIHIIHFVSAGHGKGCFYTNADHEIAFTFDKPVRDHNRMLEEEVFAQSVQNDIEWFRTLDDRKQTVVIIELIRRAGGYVQRRLTKPMWIKHFQVKRQLLRVRKAAALSFKKPLDFKDDLQAELDEQIYDPKDPTTIEVEKCVKKWNDIITKYRREVEVAKSKVTPEWEKEEPEKGSKKEGKTKKSTKPSKKGKKDKPEDEQLDLIQCLPIWMGKKIFGYLDQKTLKKLKDVNSYWAYVSQDLLTDIKMRKKLGNKLVELTGQIDPVKLEEELGIKQLDDGKTYKKHVGRISINYCDGAVFKEIIPKQTEDLVDKSLITEVRNEIYMEEECMPNVLSSFPRMIKDDILYRYVPCFLRDVDVMFGIEGDMEKQRSFLTYSLSSKIASSFSLSVEELPLDEW